MWSYFHRGIFRTKLNIYNGAFFTSVKPYFKNVLNSIELPLGCIFYTTHRSSLPEVFCKKGVLINFTKFTGKHLCQSLFFNKVFLWKLWKLLEKKSFANNRTIFFSKFETMQWKPYPRRVFKISIGWKY